MQVSLGYLNAQNSQISVFFDIFVVVSGSASDPDPDSGVFWIRIRIWIQGRKKVKMFNNLNIILIFSDYYNILSFN